MFKGQGSQATDNQFIWLSINQFASLLYPYDIPLLTDNLSPVCPP